MEDSYNGWKNRETWATHLWLSNDSQNVRWIEELIKTYRSEASYREPVKDGAITAEECIRFDLSDSLKGAFDQWHEDLCQGDPRDLSAEVRTALGSIGSLWRVDWESVAAALIA